MIKLHDVSFVYHDADTPALDHLDLEIAAGDLVVVNGHSGGGKSTLALALGGYLGRQFKGRLSGEIGVAGVDVRRSSLFATAECVGLVQQNPEDQFCTLNVVDEVAFGLENRRVDPVEIARQVDWALDAVGAVHLKARRLATLSGGEKQRVAIAAMLAAQPKVLILDEPTSSLDPEATRQILSEVDALRQASGLTVIVVEHKLDALRGLGARLITLDGGRITQDQPQLPASVDPVALRETRHPGNEALSLDHVTVSYDRLALDAVTAAFHRGQITGIMGANGAGKSTLLAAAAGLIAPDDGQVRLLGITPETASMSEVARRTGFVFQNPDHQLLADTVRDEAMLQSRNIGQGEIAEPRVRSGLVEACLTERQDSHPMALSYGQKRRLNVLAVTSHHPDVILADEALIGQDPKRASVLMESLARLADRGACIVLALHAPRAALANCDRLIYLEQGSVRFDGPPRQVLDALVGAGLKGYRVA